MISNQSTKRQDQGNLTLHDAVYTCEESFLVILAKEYTLQAYYSVFCLYHTLLIVYITLIFVYVTLVFVYITLIFYVNYEICTKKNSKQLTV